MVLGKMFGTLVGAKVGLKVGSMVSIGGVLSYTLVYVE